VVCSGQPVEIYQSLAERTCTTYLGMLGNVDGLGWYGWVDYILLNSSR
jgi:hypothetical protein